ncbi:unnamed protein product [Cuscuta epithymum]|uniref:Uncharacterized protein n=1 Tax=Cuscuta epithymum TaxID=186058 RepID=A0AAV0DQF2_9ASTE|nr:unnamed protein product [Cuscuta epithymum]
MASQINTVEKIYSRLFSNSLHLCKEEELTDAPHKCRRKWKEYPARMMGKRLLVAAPVRTPDLRLLWSSGIFVFTFKLSLI